MRCIIPRSYCPVGGRSPAAAAPGRGKGRGGAQLSCAAAYLPKLGCWRQALAAREARRTGPREAAQPRQREGEVTCSAKAAPSAGIARTRSRAKDHGPATDAVSRCFPHVLCCTIIRPPNYASTPASDWPASDHVTLVPAHFFIGGNL